MAQRRLEVGGWVRFFFRMILHTLQRIAEQNGLFEQKVTKRTKGGGVERCRLMHFAKFRPVDSRGPAGCRPAIQPTGSRRKTGRGRFGFVFSFACLVYPPLPGLPS